MTQSPKIYKKCWNTHHSLLGSDSALMPHHHSPTIEQSAFFATNPIEQMCILYTYTHICPHMYSWGWSQLITECTLFSQGVDNYGCPPVAPHRGTRRCVKHTRRNRLLSIYLSIYLPFGVWLNLTWYLVHQWQYVIPDTGHKHFLSMTEQQKNIFYKRDMYTKKRAPARNAPAWSA